jgi:hypothetical protein
MPNRAAMFGQEGTQALRLTGVPKLTPSVQSNINIGKQVIPRKHIRFILTDKAWTKIWRIRPRNLMCYTAILK